jgi:hypothetical protein
VAARVEMRRRDEKCNLAVGGGWVDVDVDVVVDVEVDVVVGIDSPTVVAVVAAVDDASLPVVLVVERH